MKFEGTLRLRIDDSEFVYKNSSVVNSATNKTFLEEGIGKAIATGELSVPRKVMVEVNNYKTPTTVYGSGPSGTGAGQYTDVGQSYTTYHSQAGILYDHKVENLDVNTNPDAKFSATSSVSNNVLTVDYTGSVGGGVSSPDWWKVDSFHANVHRIDFLDQNDESITRIDYYNSPTDVIVSYTSKINFTYSLVVTPDIDPNTSQYTIETEWLTKFGEDFEDPAVNTNSDLKAKIVKVYDDSDNPIADLSDPINEPEIAAPITLTDNPNYPATETTKYKGDATQVKPKIEPKYFIVRSGDTVNDVDIHKQEFTWNPPWLEGDSLKITYSV